MPTLHSHIEHISLFRGNDTDLSKNPKQQAHGISEQSTSEPVTKTIGSLTCLNRV